MVEFMISDRWFTVKSIHADPYVSRDLLRHLSSDYTIAVDTPNHFVDVVKI